MSINVNFYFQVKLFIFIVFQFATVSVYSKPLNSLLNFESKFIANEKFEILNFTKNNQPVLLFFWASWCNQCKQTRQSIEKIKTYHRNLKIIGIGTDEKFADSKKAAFVEYRFISKHYWINQATIKDINLNILPMMVLITKSGKIDTVYEGKYPDKLHYLMKRVGFINENNL